MPFFKNAMRYAFALAFCEALILFLAGFCFFTSAALFFMPQLPSAKKIFIEPWLFLCVLWLFLCARFFMRKGNDFKTPERLAAYIEKKMKIQDNVLTTALYYEMLEGTDSVSGVLLKRLFCDAQKQCEKLEAARCFDRTFLKKSSVLLCAMLFVSFYMLSFSSAHYKAAEHAATARKKATFKKHEILFPFEMHNVAWKIQYPAYTLLTDKTLDTVDEISAPYGSKILFSGKSSLRISSATVKSVDAVNISWKERSFSGALTATQTQNVSLLLESGARSKKVFSVSVKTVSDEPPQVLLAQPQEETLAFANKDIPLEIQAEDDYGISRLVLVVRKNKERPKGFPLSFAKSSQVYLQYSFSPSSFLSQSGDEIVCAVEAYDNDVFFGPKRARSKSFRVMFPKLAVQKQIKELPQKNLEKMSGSLYEKQSSLLDELNKTLQDIKTAQKITSEHKEALLELTQKQEQLFKDAESFQKTIKETQNDPSAQNELKELTSVLSEVDKQMSEILSEDMKKALEKLRDAISKTQLNDIEKKLLEAKVDQEELLRKFRQTMNWLKMAKDEQFLSMMDKMLKDMLKRQEELLEKTKKLPSAPEGTNKQFKWKDLSFQQEALKKDTADFQKLMEMEQAKPEKNKELMEHLSKFSKDMKGKSVNEKMSGAAKSLGEENFSKSMSMEQQSQKALSELSEQFEELQAGWFLNQKKKFARLLFELTGDVLLVSEQEETVRKDISALRSLPPTELITVEKSQLQNIASRQAKLSEQTEKMREKLARLAELLPVMDISLLSQVAGIQQVMQNAQKNVDDGLMPQAETLSQRAVDGLNSVAQELLKVQEKAKNFSASKMLEEYLKRVSDLAEMQGMLNDKTMAFSSSGEVSLFGLKQLAFEQEKLRQMLGKLSSGLKPLSPSASSMLGGAGDEMEDVTERIKQKDVGKEVQKMQKKIHHKLLEAQLALKDQGKEEGRKAETAKSYKPKPALKPLVLKKEPFFKIKNEKLKWNESLIPEEYRSAVNQYLKSIGQ